MTFATMPARLFTASGEPVQTVTIPLLDPPPAMLAWQNRLFVRTAALDSYPVVAYVEGQAYALIDGITCARDEAMIQ